MNIGLVCVGKPREPLASAIEAYESRISHYYSFEAVEVKEATNRSVEPAAAVVTEGDRLLARVSDHHELIVLDRGGKRWSSEYLSTHLLDSGAKAVAGVTFVIGGAFGISPHVRSRAAHLLSLSSMTLPHELARLVLAEQIYRAGTIFRGEPYHKGPLK